MRALAWTPSTRARFKVGAAYFQYQDIASKLNPTLSAGLYDLSKPQFSQKGNSRFILTVMRITMEHQGGQ